MRRTKKGASKTPCKSDPTKTHLKCSCGEGLIIDTAVCHIPKVANRETDPLKYQTLCPSCGSIGSVELTEAQLQEMIQEEDEMNEVLLVSGAL
jgi:hypothetical protein